MAILDYIIPVIVELQAVTARDIARGSDELFCKVSTGEGGKLGLDIFTGICIIFSD